MPSVAWTTPSQMSETTNSAGLPPASKTPFETSSIRPRKWKVPGWPIPYALSTSTCGFRRSSTVQFMPSRSASPWKLTSRRRWLRSRFGSIGAGLSSVAMRVLLWRDVSQQRALFSGQPERSRVSGALPLELQVDDVARLHRERLDDQVVEALSRLPVDLEDDVAGPQAGLVCWAACGHGPDEQAGGSSCRAGELGRNRLDLQAEARPSDLLPRDQLVGDPFGEVDRDRKPEANASAGAVREARAGGIDADETRIAVDERAAAVPRIDRCVRLNRAHEMCGLAAVRRDPHIAVERTHDPGCHRAGQPQGRTEGNDRLAHSERARQALLDRRKVGVVLRLDDGKVGERVPSDDRGVRALAVASQDREGPAARRNADDVVVGQDVSARSDDDARAAAALAAVAGSDGHDRR